MTLGGFLDRRGFGLFLDDGVDLGGVGGPGFEDVGVGGAEAGEPGFAGAQVAFVDRGGEMLGGREAVYVLAGFGKKVGFFEEGGRRQKAVFDDVRGQNADLVGGEFQQMRGVFDGQGQTAGGFLIGAVDEVGRVERGRNGIGFCHMGDVFHAACEAADGEKVGHEAGDARGACGLGHEQRTFGIHAGAVAVEAVEFGQRRGKVAFRGQKIAAYQIVGIAVVAAEMVDFGGGEGQGGFGRGEILRRVGAQAGNGLPVVMRNGRLGCDLQALFEAGGACGVAAARGEAEEPCDDLLARRQRGHGLVRVGGVGQGVLRDPFVGGDVEGLLDQNHVVLTALGAEDFEIETDLSTEGSGLEFGVSGLIRFKTPQRNQEFIHRRDCNMVTVIP